MLALISLSRSYCQVACLVLGVVVVMIGILPPGSLAHAAPGARSAYQLLARQELGRQELGRLLFFEPALSVNGKRSCASCHRPEKAFCDQRTVPRALRFADNLARNTPTLLNAAGQATFFHDGRAGSLAEVLTAVLTNPREFGSSYAEATARLQTSTEYRWRFQQAFGAGAGITPATLADAFGAYLGTLAGQHAAYDRARRGGPALDTAARAGERLFAGAAGCAGCHGGALFRDGKRHEIEPGQWVKTPTLRNVALTMPYGAAGRYPTLAAVLGSAYHRAQAPRPLGAGEVRRLEALLLALTDTVVGRSAVPMSLPALPALPERVVGGLY